MDIEILKQNPRTAYIAQEYEKLLNQEKELDELLSTDASLFEMVSQEKETITIQKKAFEEQIKEIEKVEKEE